MRQENPGERLTAILDHPDRPALLVPEDGQVLTYGQVADRVASLAGSLARAGVRRGDRVALTIPSGADMIQLLLAITALGAAAAPLNPAYTHSEYVFYLTDIAPRVFVMPASRPAAASSAAEECSMTVVTARAAGNGPPVLLAGDKELSPATSFEAGQPDDVGVVLHTSGTTSRPKQVPLRQRNLMASTRTVAAHYGLGSADVSFCVMPMFHVHGLVASTFAALAGGGSVILPRRFTPQRFWRQARQHGATWLSAGPTLHQMILERADAAGGPATLRFARSCSSALSPALMERAERGYGVPMLEAYGDDRGQPPDGVEPAASGEADRRLGRCGDGHGDRRRRSGRHHAA
jgi:acyl-CoA synthetase (AMP-forming)/AMP-acid ligase II